MMNNHIQIFENPEFGQVRTLVDEKGEPWFVGKDVADALGYKNARDAIAKHVENDDVAKRDIVDFKGRSQPNTFVINESGVYSLIFGSKLERAKVFKHWVTSEVLPAIRKTGGYVPVKEGDSDIDILARAVLIAHRQIEERNKLIEVLQPRAEYADEVLDSVDCYTISQVAKEMGMTGVELNQLLSRKGVQFRQSGQWMLYADYARRGYATTRTFFYRDIFGDGHSILRTVWTERGRQFLHSFVDEVRGKM